MLKNWAGNHSTMKLCVRFFFLHNMKLAPSGCVFQYQYENDRRGSWNGAPTVNGLAVV